MKKATINPSEMTTTNRIFIALPSDPKMTARSNIAVVRTLVRPERIDGLM